MADAVPLLETLRALREPPAPASITPYLLAVAVGVIVAVSIVAVVAAMTVRRRRIRRAAEAELALSRKLPPGERLAAQAMLLRRLVRTTARTDDAPLHGPAWLARLDHVFATTFFSRGEGCAYGAALYAPNAAADIESLDRALARFIARVRP